jgi:hypothetical protein
LEEEMTTEKDEIEIVFDETTHTYHAFWRPPLAIGAGDSAREAVADLREAIRFSVETSVNKIEEVALPMEPDVPVTNGDRQQTAIYEYLPHRNCGKCGFVNCWSFADALIKGEAFLDACQKLHSDQVEKIAVLLPAQTPLRNQHHREHRRSRE